VFEIERIFPNSAVQCIAVYTDNDESLWQLSQKHIVLNVIHVAGGYQLTALSKLVQMMGKLHLDLLCQDKYLLNHVDLKIKLRRSRDAFALVAEAANYKIKIKEMACIAVYTDNDESLWQLSQKHIVLNVIHVAGGYRVHFYFYSSDVVFTTGLFQCFHVNHSNGGIQLYLSHIQSHFLDLDGTQR
jgi:hypothetical protein